jgi:hypothetical protein
MPRTRVNCRSHDTDMSSAIMNFFTMLKIAARMSLAEQAIRQVSGATWSRNDPTQAL